MIEAMTVGGFRPRGAILAPRDAFEGDAVIFPYAAKFVPVRHVLVEKSQAYAVNDVSIRTSIAHLHGVQTFGLHFTYGGSTISYMPCGRFFDGLAEDYAEHAPDVLIVNVLRYRDSMKVDHLNFDECRTVLRTVRPKVAVLTHFSTRMLEAGPERLARELEDELGIRVFAAHDGWMFDASNEIAAAAAFA
jgi:phosphoribosyl 1,2-cyclic phosphodiesterase